ncbi:hypothetical protein AK830_g9695 [Neonectria ditissima]|uniref:Uncharacterized protein n=1 Tax=Neonectria ditissima TaxID=78410 RepID=A0A0P7B599_9HYPO|nr:hypothetical protein AK830_g9695 [Neonectria ditissima]
MASELTAVIRPVESILLQTDDFPLHTNEFSEAIPPPAIDTDQRRATKDQSGKAKCRAGNDRRFEKKRADLSCLTNAPPLRESDYSVSTAPGSWLQLPRATIRIRARFPS